MALLAWSGAVLFALSLAYFLFSYAVTFGEPAAAGSAAGAVAWNTVLFPAFALHHSVFARERIRAWVARTVPPELERSAYVWVASVLFLAVCALWRPVPGVAWDMSGPWLWLLRALQLAGVWITLRSAAILDVRELAGIIPTRTSPTRPTRPMEFTRIGPYGWVRHPIYTGWFLMVWAASPMTMTRLVFAVVSCFYLLVAIPFEERSLRRSSSGAYERYSSAVRWKLLLGVY